MAFQKFSASGVPRTFRGLIRGHLESYETIHEDGYADVATLPIAAWATVKTRTLTAAEIQNANYEILAVRIACNIGSAGGTARCMVNGVQLGVVYTISTASDYSWLLSISDKTKSYEIDLDGYMSGGGSMTFDAFTLQARVRY